MVMGKIQTKIITHQFLLFVHVRTLLCARWL